MSGLEFFQYINAQWYVYNDSHPLTLMSHQLTASGWSPWVWPWIWIPTYWISSISLLHTFLGCERFLLNFVIFPDLGNSALTQVISSQIILLVSSCFPWSVSHSLSRISHPHIITRWQVHLLQPWDKRLGSALLLVKPIIYRKLSILPYQALGACFRP